MKTLTLVWLFSLGMLIAQTSNQPAKYDFSMVIENTDCRITTYQPSTPIVFAPMVEKNFRPKSQLMLALMLTKSDISSYLSDEEIAAFSPTSMTGVEIQTFRSSMKKRFEMTGPTAEANPWKGMKYAVDRVFVVESDKGKFLLYQFSTQGGEVNGKLYGSLKHVAGRWQLGGTKTKAAQVFQKSMLTVIPEEFAKRKESAGIEVVPLEDLLN